MGLARAKWRVGCRRDSLVERKPICRTVYNSLHCVYHQSVLATPTAIPKPFHHIDGIKCHYVQMPDVGSTRDAVRKAW